VSTVRATVLVGGLASDAEALWYDTARWPDFVDGLESVEAVAGDWPRAGGTVEWTSHPTGRGRVREEVLVYEARRGQESSIEDPEITGTQRIAFVPQGDRVAVTLELTYTIKSASIATPLVDLFFVRGAQRASLTRTLERFRDELRAR
jgi:hypothetical protein